MNVKVIFWTLVLDVLLAEAGMMGDQCDWTSSGLTSNSERAVTPVHLRCREGTISWQYPRGALRLLFRPRRPPDDRDFRVCVRIMRHSDPPDLFHELHDNDTEVVERFPARLFVEGIDKLVPLYSPDDGDPREVRCFRSHAGQAIYAEAEPEAGPRRRVATFLYEIRPLVKRHYDPATADCRPCTDSELQLAFCTSDLVARAIIVGSEQREDLDTTQLTLRVTKLIRVTGATGPGADADEDDDDQYYRYELTNPTESSPSSHNKHRGRRRVAGTLHAHVQVGAACGAEAGGGEFLVMARRRLGRYTVACAPRAEHWAKVVGSNDSAGAPCPLRQ